MRNHAVSGSTPRIHKPRILLVEDDASMAAGLFEMLGAEFKSVVRVSDDQTLFEEARRIDPDVVVLHLGNPSLDTAAIEHRLNESLPDSKIISVAAANESGEGTLRQSRESGFLIRSSRNELVSAIKRVFNKGSHASPRRSKPITSDLHKAKALTARQREVLQLLAEGHTMKRAAKVLGLAARTIAFHKYKIMQDFGLKNNLDLLRLALREHVIQLP